METMLGIFQYISIVLGVLFVVSMINVITYTHRQRKQWKNQQDAIASEGYMRLYLRIESGRGEIFVESVDELPPLHISEVQSHPPAAGRSSNSVYCTGKGQQPCRKRPPLPTGSRFI